VHAGTVPEGAALGEFPHPPQLAEGELLKQDSIGVQLHDSINYSPLSH